MPIDNAPLLQFLRNEETQARDTALENQRAVAISMYQGEPFGNEVEGRSALVTREVAQAVDFDLVGILKTVISADRVVQFETNDQASSQMADDASALIHYDFMRKQDGYQILHDWIKLGLLEKTGVVKSWVEHPTKDVTVEVPQEAFQPGDGGNLTIDGNPVIGDPEHLNADEMALDPMTGIPMPAPAVYRAKVRQPLPPKFLDAAVPNEEFGLSADTRALDPSPYLYHVQQKSLSDLHAMGFEFDDDALYSSNSEAQVISDARDSQRSRRETDPVRRGPLRKVWYREEYALYDFNEDGIAERILVKRVGQTIFTVEEVEEQPFEGWCPYPMAGRFVGQSLADKCSDIQVVNSTLLRQGMDSLYLSTNPRTLIHEQSIGDNTIDDLLTVRSGMLIRYTGGTAPPTPWATIPVHQQAFEGMQQMTDMLESRTGISRLNQGLDADTFDRSGVAINAMQTAGQQMQEARARNFVEAMRRLFAKKYRMMRRYGVPVTLVVDGKPREIDPRQWPEDIDIRVNVGLGTGNRDRRLALLQTAIQATSQGLDDGTPIFTQKNLYNLTKEWYQNASLGIPSDFIVDPDSQPQPDPSAPKPPSPEEIAAQGKAQADQAKIQSDHELAMGKLTLQQQAQQASDALKSQQNDQQLAAAREKNALDMELARQKAAFEAGLAQQTADREYALAIQRMERDHALKQQQAERQNDLPQNRPGGQLDQ